MKKLFTTLAAISSFSCSPLALAGGHGGGGHGGGGVHSSGGHFGGGGHFSGARHYSGGHSSGYGRGYGYGNRGNGYYGGGNGYYGGGIGLGISPDYGYGSGDGAYPSYGYSPGYGYDNASDQASGPAVGSIAEEIQSALAQQGFYRGEIDGIIGPATVHAITRYQAVHGLQVTGVIDAGLLRSLGIQ